jgi:hypothetical protein
MVGTVFLHQIGVATLPKCDTSSFHQTGYDLVFLGIFIIPPFILAELLFFPYKQPKKRSKRRLYYYNQTI